MVFSAEREFAFSLDPPSLNTAHCSVVIEIIEAPALIERILAHLTQRAEEEEEDSPFASRAPPPRALF